MAPTIAVAATNCITRNKRDLRTPAFYRSFSTTNPRELADAQNARRMAGAHQAPGKNQGIAETFSRVRTRRGKNVWDVERGDSAAYARRRHRYRSRGDP